MPVLAEAVDRLSLGEQERLLSIATVRGYRLQVQQYPRELGGKTMHYAAKLGPGTREKVTHEYPSKRLARRALLQLMMDQTRRTAA